MMIQYSQIFLSILLALTCQKVIARFEYGPPYAIKPEIPETVDEYNNYSQEYSDLAKDNPNFLANWPYLKELLPPSYPEDIPELLPTPQPQKMHQSKSNSNNLKDHWEDKNYKPQQKKNSNYMSACHFKICNLGRKRNVRFIKL